MKDAPYKTIVQGIFLVLNLGLMLFLAAVGALGVGASNSTDDTGVIFVGIYLIIFAGIVFIYEAVQVCHIEMLDNLWKRNFGFLYGTIGKGIFILL